MSYAVRKIDELLDRETALSVSLYVENQKMKKMYINKFLNYCRMEVENESKRVASGEDVEFKYIRKLGTLTRNYKSLLGQIELRKQLGDIHQKSFPDE